MSGHAVPVGTVTAAAVGDHGEADVPVVELEAAGRTYRAGDVSVAALRDATLRIDRGEHVAVVGPSGSGKSTMLNLLGLLDHPTEGRCLLEGIDTATLSERQRAGLRSRRIGFVFQAFHLLGHRSVLDNVLLATIYSRMSRGERLPAAREALERVGLGHRADFRPTQLSGGERQRVAIARATVTRPALLLCDEPTGNLDTATGAAVLALFDELVGSGLTLVVVTHDERASAHARRVIHLLDGRLVQDTA